MTPRFVHLRLHSEFALQDSIIRIDDLLATCQSQGLAAVALTDPGNFYALVRFYRGARSQGIKPVFGADLELEQGEGQLSLLVLDEEGYHQLIVLLSRAHTEPCEEAAVVMRRAWVEGAAGHLLLLLSRYSDVGRALERGDVDRARQLLERWREVFGADKVYLELQRTGRPGDEDFVHQAVSLAAATATPVVASNDVRFLRREDFEVHETRVCIAEKTTLGDTRRSRRYSAEQYLKSEQEMLDLFADIPEALANSVQIALRCNLELTLGKSFLPNFPVPAGMTIEDYLSVEAHQRLEKMLPRLVPEGQAQREAACAVYRERLQAELSIINSMGFAGYFLIVMDFIRWAKEHGVPVGPGRGSGAGSLVAYALAITDLDPLRYDLLFERFLNPERVSMPDFDIDFCMEGRDRVIDYVAHAYGREAVSQITTFSTMAAKAVVRDVARVLGKSYGLADRMSKLIPAKPPGITLAEARAAEPQLEVLLSDASERDHEDALEIWERAVQLEGITRGVGKHAGGVLIAPGRLTDFTPIFCDEEGKWVSQYDKDDVEKVGLVKFDFLGLRTLTIIDWAMQHIAARRRREDLPELDLTTLALDDAATYRMIQEGRTTAVFQLESPGMKNLQKKLKPSNFEDLIALVALFRPGPLDSGMVDDFINRKHGLAAVAYPDVQYQHACLKPVLEPTYGVIVYQEQVMQIAQVMAGFSLGAADLLRRAMGKKKAEEMAEQREIFVQGATAQGIETTLSGHIFDLMEKFAGYGFNKSHSAAYALLSYQTAWLKQHYPAEFMAAVLSAEMHNIDNVVFLVAECRSMGLAIAAPHVNRSAYRFLPQPGQGILYGLGAIKGLGQGAVEALLEARQHGSFKDLFDLCARIDVGKINKRSLEVLILAGAMDGLGGDRATMLAGLDLALQVAAQQHRNRDVGIVDMFGTVEPDEHWQLPQVPAWEQGYLLTQEKATLGLYLSGHPLQIWRQELQAMHCHPLQGLEPTRQNVSVRIAGLLQDKRLDKRGRAILTLEDEHDRLEVVVESELLLSCGDLLQPDQLLIVEGDVRYDKFREAPAVRAWTVYDLAGGRLRHGRRMQFTVSSTLPPQKVQELAQQLAAWRQKGTANNCRVTVQLTAAGYSTGMIWANDWCLPAHAEVIALLEQWSGSQVTVYYG